jgi:type IV pilus assembly protein PilA
MKETKSNKGFSLIELLIVVAILSIIAAIAIPNLLASKRAANDGSALASMRTIHSAQSTYRSTAGNGEYGTLAELMNEKLLDTSIGSGSKSGYTFSCPDTNLTPSPQAEYFATAVPTDTAPITRTGYRSFTVAEDGRLRGKFTDTAAGNHGEAINGAIWPLMD